MKRLLLSLTLATSMMASLSSFAGGETSGGGDAVYVEDQLVLRDFIEGSSFKTVLRNDDFLHSIPDFQELILEISKVNPVFALKIVKDLMKANLYQSTRALPLLPASTTAMSGPKADVQLAIRNRNDIMLAPNIQKIKDASYVMVHEALHSLLYENEGPMHHHRVRAIVKYLKDNRGKYDKDSLSSILEKNYYVSRLGETSEFFNLTDLDLKCHVIRGKGYILEESYHAAESFFNLDCSKANIENYLSRKVFSSPSRETSYKWDFGMIVVLADSKVSYPISRLDLPSTRFYQKDEINDQKMNCRINQNSLKFMVENLERHQFYLGQFQEYAKALNSESLTKSEKLVIQEYISGSNEYERQYYEVDYLSDAGTNLTVKLEAINEQVSIGQDNAKRCAAKFPNGL